MALPAARTFTRYAEWLMGRIRWAASGAGAAASGYIGILTDAASEGAQQAFYSKLPGHDHCANDSLDVAGEARALIKFPGEPRALWQDRVRTCWKDYEQQGSSFCVIDAVNDWGKVYAPSTWLANATLAELSWARFAVTIPYGNTDWGPAEDYGDLGLTYGSGAVYGVSNVDPNDIALLRAQVRKWKPARSKAYIRVVLSTGFFYGDGHTYGSPGLTYTTTQYVDLTV